MPAPLPEGYASAVDATRQHQIAARLDAELAARMAERLGVNGR